MAELTDPAPAYNHVAGVEDCRLPRSYGALRLIKSDPNVLPNLLDGRGGRLVAMADLHADSHRLAQLVNRNQVHATSQQSTRVQILCLADNHLLGVSSDL